MAWRFKKRKEYPLPYYMKKDLLNPLLRNVSSGKKINVHGDKLRGSFSQAPTQPKSHRARNKPYPPSLEVRKRRLRQQYLPPTVDDPLRPNYSEKSVSQLKQEANKARKGEEQFVTNKPRMSVWGYRRALKELEDTYNEDGTLKHPTSSGNGEEEKPKRIFKRNPADVVQGVDASSIGMDSSSQTIGGFPFQAKKRQSAWEESIKSSTINSTRVSTGPMQGGKRYTVAIPMPMLNTIFNNSYTYIQNQCLDVDEIDSMAK